MQDFKVLKRNITPTASQLQNYNQSRNHTRSTNIRFGKLIMLSDADLDG